MKTNRIQTILKWFALLLTIATFNQIILVYKFNKAIERVDKIEVHIDSLGLHTDDLTYK